MKKRELHAVRTYLRLERKVVTPEVEAGIDSGLYQWEAVECYLLGIIYDHFLIAGSRMEQLLSEYDYNQRIMSGEAMGL